MVRDPAEIVKTLSHAGPGRFVVEESSMAGELPPSGYSCQRWGTAIRHDDGSVTLDPDPWEERGTNQTSEGSPRAVP
jgi:hypothetical protein